MGFNATNKEKDSLDKNNSLSSQVQLLKIIKDPGIKEVKTKLLTGKITC